MQKIIDICEKAAEKIDDAELKELCLKLRDFYNDEQSHKSTITFIGLSNLKNLVKLLGIEIPNDFSEKVNFQNSCIVLDYNEKLGLEILREDILCVYLPTEILQHYRVMICNGERSKREWLEVSCETDIACFFTNAVMAMNLTEKQWLEEYGTFFAPDSLVLIILNMELLDADEDFVPVRERVNKTLQSLKMSSKVFEVPHEAMDYVKDFLARNDLDEKRKARAIRNYLYVIKNEAEKLSREFLSEEQAVNETIEKLNKHQDFLETSGKFIADNVFYNAMATLESEVDDGVRAYGHAMCGNIERAIEAASAAELEFIDEKVDTYIHNSWEYYLNEITKKLDIEREKITEKLISQMDFDVNEFISDLDETSRKAVYEALTSRKFETAKNPSKTTFYAPEASEIMDRVKRETRNMILLSIPIFLFVNPLVAIGNIFASKLIEKVRIDKSIEDSKKQLVAQVEKICAWVAEEILKELHSNFDSETEKTKTEIKLAYKVLIDHIVTELAVTKEKQKNILETKRILDKVVEEVS